MSLDSCCHVLSQQISLCLKQCVLRRLTVQDSPIGAGTVGARILLQ